MANDNTTKNSTPKGFYYDTQLSNPLLTATLHPNTYISNVDVHNGDPYESGKPFKWELYEPNPNGDKKDKEITLEPLTDNSSLGTYKDKNPSACYRKRPLITAILNEDFQVEIGNQWGEAGGSTGFEDTFNKLKSLAAMNNEVGLGVDNLMGEIEKITNPDPNSFGGGLLRVGRRIANTYLNSREYLNKALITQGTRFSYYGGTSTTFGNLNMRFTIFADWIYDEEYGCVFKTVHEQLREIYPYAIGKYDPIDPNFNDLVDNDGGTADEATKAIDKTICTFFGWQSPPGGFQADIRSLDTCQLGTLRLVMGGYYTAENLVISGMNVNFSKVMTKIPPRGKSINYFTDRFSNVEEFIDPETGISEFRTEDSDYDPLSLIKKNLVDNEGGLTPLYADVTISLRPASHYTDNSIIHFSSNKGRGKIELEIADLRNKSLRMEIDKKKEKMSSRYEQRIGRVVEINEVNRSTSHKPTDLPDKLPFPKDDYLSNLQTPTIDGGELDVVTAPRIEPLNQTIPTTQEELIKFQGYNQWNNY